ncbi:MAG: hypothetical protein Ta2E_04220 [Mycoplasmoidaceae bacterium]|nr:MAG: hypothetical protein Ta2E_04220 [Mycoplasmoidaceae bacterium]
MNELVNKIIDGCKDKKSFFITGPAGVGKTYLVKEIYNELKKNGVGVALTSTTGINALNLGGITVHKFFGLMNRTDKGYIGFMKSSFLFRGISMRLAKVDVVIIDEVSMLRADTLELIDEIMKQATKCDKPFGGKSIIFTGDFYQIAPVVKNYESNKNQWIFNSPSWIDANINTIVLDKMYRQKDERFIHFLQNLRIGELTKQDEVIIKECEKNTSLSDDTTIFFSTNEECDNWNETKLKKLSGQEYIYEAEIRQKGHSNKRKKEKESLARDCIAKQILKIKVGARVISIINDKDGRFVNGSTGYVTECNISGSKKSISVLFDSQDEPVLIKAYMWIKKDFNGRKLATFKQIPVIPAYALTIHKSQGLTLDKAIVDCKNIFVSGQLYVALSRVRTMEGLKIINFHKSQLIVNQEVKKFYNH